jgi:uncharacterized protein
MQMERVDLSGLAVVTGYGEGAFRVAGKRYEGSLLVGGEVLHLWPVTDAGAITIESLAPLLETAEPPDLILFGTGRTARLLPPEVDRALKARGIAAEAMDTGAACRTYSFLTMEGRRVAGALIAL